MRFSQKTVVGIALLVSTFALGAIQEFDAVRFSGWRIELAGLGASDPAVGWRSVEGGGFRMETAETAVATDQFQHGDVGRVVYEPLALTTTLVERPGWSQWLESHLQGLEPDTLFRGVTVTEIDHRGEIGASFSYQDCFISRYVFPVLDVSQSDVVATEGFVLQPNGFDLSSLRMVGAEGDRQTAFTNTFRVSIESAETAAEAVVSVQIDDLVFPSLPDATGRANAVTFAPGSPQFGDVRLRLRAHPESEIAPWWEETAQGQPARREVIVEVVAPDDEALRSYRFVGCRLIGYQPAAYEGTSGAVHELLTLRPERVEIGSGTSLIASASSGGSSGGSGGGSTSSTPTPTPGAPAPGGNDTGSGSGTAETGGNTPPATPETNQTSPSAPPTPTTSPAPSKKPPVLTQRPRLPVPVGRGGRLEARSVSKDRKGVYYFYVDAKGKKLRIPATRVLRVERLKKPLRNGARFYLYLRPAPRPRR